MTADFSHCLPYSLTVQSEPYEEEEFCVTTTLDFSLANYLTTAGNGLSYASARKLSISRTPGTLHYTYFTVKKDSVLRVVAKPNTELTSISIDVTGSFSDLNGWRVYSTKQEKTIVFKVKANVNYILSFSASMIDVSQVCPYFDVDIILGEEDVFASQVLCPDFETPDVKTTPDQLTIDSDGYGSFYVFSHIPSGQAYIRWNTEFSVTNDSIVEVEFDYPALAADFELVLWKRTGSVGSYAYVSLARDTMQPISLVGSNAFALATMMTDNRKSIIGRVEAGTYRISLRQLTMELAPTDVALNRTRTLCYPYSFFARVAPADHSALTIRNVSPIGLSHIDIRRNLVLSIEFPQQPTDQNGDLITNGDLIAQSLQLKSSDGTQIKRATSATSSSPFMKWTVVFGSDTLQYSKSYKLVLEPSKLFYEGEPLVLSAEHQFSTLRSSCGDFGTFDAGAGGCDCQSGYTGLTCASCSLDAVLVNNKTECVKVEPCKQDSCGCLYTPESPLDCLMPLGQCTNDAVDGHITCACNSTMHVTGATCSVCEEGYFGYPACREAKQCPAECQNGGSCDLATGTCLCRPRFAGDTCNVCAAGFKGKDCATVVGVETVSDKVISIVRAVAMGIAALLILGTIILFIVRGRKIKKAQASYHRMMSRVDENGELSLDLPNLMDHRLGGLSDSEGEDDEDSNFGNDDDDDEDVENGKRGGPRKIGRAIRLADSDDEKEDGEEKQKDEEDNNDEENKKEKQQAKQTSGNELSDEGKEEKKRKDTEKEKVPTISAPRKQPQVAGKKPSASLNTRAPKPDFQPRDHDDFEL